MKICYDNSLTKDERAELQGGARFKQPLFSALLNLKLVSDVRTQLKDEPARLLTLFDNVADAEFVRDLEAFECSAKNLSCSQCEEQLISFLERVDRDFGETTPKSSFLLYRLAKLYGAHKQYALSGAYFVQALWNVENTIGSVNVLSAAILQGLQDLALEIGDRERAENIQLILLYFQEAFDEIGLMDTLKGKKIDPESCLISKRVGTIAA